MAEGHDFELDRFQLEAIAVVDQGKSVVVAAPTGAGKTVVAEHAIARVLAGGGRVFYTTPIKALSNQKYGDLVRRHGKDRVGLLTGDNTINGQAPVVVMTTEVLRNMIYASSPALDHLEVVVLDEVHYLQDTYRGPVWEEVIIHSPARVRMVALSATVSNAGELADWMATVRGPTEVVVEHQRPVELANLYLVADRSSEHLQLIPTLVDGKPNPEGERFDNPPERGRRHDRRRKRPKRFTTPRRVDVIDELHGRDMLPAIYFIFSRAGCDEAVAHAIRGGIRLTTDDQRQRIRHIVRRHTALLSFEDLDALGYPQWMTGLEQGIGAHHAGLVPAFKEAVEECFAEGLLSVVFATETLALGINMPARSVVIEKLTKFTGEHHEQLTPGQYTQFTGRAGRRGIDDRGHAVVLWTPWVSFGEVASLAASTSFALRSAFRPTYNMAANLVRRYPPDEARQLLNKSFAQYQTDRAVVELETRVDRRRAALAEAIKRAECGRGDVRKYRDLRRAADEAVRNEMSQGDLADAVSRLNPGDVIRIRSGVAVVLSVAYRKSGTIRTRLVDRQGESITFELDDFDHLPEALAQIELPKPYTPNNRGFQHEVARELGRARVRPSSNDDRRFRRGDGDQSSDPRIDALESHPVTACPDRRAHLRALTQVERITDELRRLGDRMTRRTGTLSRRFDQVLDVLEKRGFVEGWSLTEKGQILVRCYHEADLLVAETLFLRLLDGLDAPTLAGLVSTLTHEHRSRNPPPDPWFPTEEARARFSRMQQLAVAINMDEEQAGLPLSRPPEGGFAAIAHAWAAGQDLDELMDSGDMSGGDFVRGMKQLLDLLRQIGEIAPDASTARVARQAAEMLQRGVVAASSGVDDGSENPPG